MTPVTCDRTGRALLFPIGAVVFSDGVDRLMREGRLDPMPFLHRHMRGDWGEGTDYQWQANNAVLQSGGRLQSFFRVHRELALSIVTEADRSTTTISLSSEY